MEDLKYKGKKIVFCSIQEYCQITQMPISAFINNKTSSIKDGCCIIDKKNEINIVLYDGLLSNFERKNWSLAHEVGHIYMGHTKDGRNEEIEANFFAAQLFMPEFTLYMMRKKYGAFDIDDLMEIFGVSHLSAEKRIKTFKNKSMFNAGKNDIAIWQRQAEKIDLYFRCKKYGEDFRSSLEMLNWYNEEMQSFMYH